MRSTPLLIGLLLLSACVPTPVAPPAPVSAPAAPPAAAPPPAPPVGWREQPFAAGAWTYRADILSASFGMAGNDPELVLRCDRAGRRVTISRRGVGQGQMTLLATSRAQTFAAAAIAGRTEVVIVATDPTLDRFVTSRGRVGVAVTGLSTLILPTWAEPVRVVEDCRR